MSQSHVQARSWFARAARARPVTTYLMLALPSSYLVLIVAAMMEYQVIPGREVVLSVHDNLEESASFAAVICLLVSAIAVTAATDGVRGVRDLLRRSTYWRVSPVWWIVAVVALPSATIAIATLLGDTARLPTASTLLAELGATLTGLLLINLWEETAWAGFMQSRLRLRHSLVTAAAITTVPFALVHLPLRVITHETTTIGAVVINFVVLTGFLIVFRTLLGIVLEGSGSLLLVAVTHTFFNRSNNVDGLAADILTGEARSISALLATLLVTIVAAAFLARHRRHMRSADARFAPTVSHLDRS